ncbi:hypothetical protein Sjap_010786 [Stephania japonica]|uniref:VQ domain-containing protein n=1 Tax=Stephania japonica TaxID=461633 RepID=A0AAP0P4W2_9MAGN
MEKQQIQTPNSHSLINSIPSTTFVQADAHAFRDLVQRLTGADENSPARPLSAGASDRGGVAVGPRRSASFKRINKLEITKFGLRKAPPSSPSPVTPLASESVFSSAAAAAEEEERVIAEKGFYLHPSPKGAEPPQLLPLFPLTSPKQEQRLLLQPISPRDA